ncbi:MAG: hypothetical protein JXR75_05355 [Rhodobacteraceae bacterium]|nr:hypothetical protein [Paracoccaceae bacterium]
MKRLILLFLLAASGVQAQDIVVRSGDHAGFTRLVLQGTTVTDWTLGRTQTGYGLRFDLETIRYDLASAFDLISRDRIRGLSVDAATGGLDITLGCDCHAIPFEFAPNVLVIDIKDGPAPPQSVFEARLDGAANTPPDATANLTGPASARYDWLALNGAAAAAAAPPTPRADARRLAAEVDQNAFRSLLAEELGRGATAGVVKMQPVAGPRPQPGALPAEPAQARAALEGLPGIAIAAPGQPAADLTSDGAICPSDDALDPTRWGMTDDANADLLRARQALLAEFDIPNADQVTLAARTYLYYGFGAEARAVRRAFPTAAMPGDAETALSFIIDGAPPPDDPFQSMQGCDTTVALWAALSRSESSANAPVNGAAASRSFLALPGHLRLLLGPRLHAALLRSGDTTNAEVVKQSLGRVAMPDTATIPLLDARQALHHSDPDQAEAALDQIKDGQDAMEALLARVEARFQSRTPLEGSDLVALEAFAFEQAGGPRKADLSRALAHAYALGDNYPAAFQQAAGSADLATDVWSVLAAQGPDAALLEVAVGAPEATISRLGKSLRAAIAARLVGAGLPNAALAWVAAPDSDLRIVAQVHLANADARSALRTLAALPAPETADLLAEAYQSLQAYDQASALYLAAGNTDAADRLNRWQGRWPDADEGSDTPWAVAAASLAPSVPPGALPPLQASAAQLEASAATRAAIQSLLAAAPSDPVATPP